MAEIGIPQSAVDGMGTRSGRYSGVLPRLEPRETRRARAALGVVAAVHLLMELLFRFLGYPILSVQAPKNGRQRRKNSNRVSTENR
jgi:hypothetical protein